MPQAEPQKTTYEYDQPEARGKVEFDSGNYGPCFVVTAPDGTQYTGFIDLFHFAKQGSALQIVIDTPNHAEGPTFHVWIWPDGRVETFRE